MDTDVLRWFQLVADGTTVTEVSAVERITQSGLSRALARLEAEVGTPLLHRSGRTLRTTQAGAAFKRHVDAMLHQLGDGLAAVEQLVDPETGTVTVASQPSLGTWLVPDLVRGMRTVHPNVKFVLHQMRDDLDAPDLDDGRVELLVTAARPGGPSVRWRRLLVEPLALALPRGHALAERDQVDLSEVSGEPFIALRPSSRLRALGEALCADAGFRPTVAFEGDDLWTVCGFVAAGLGVAIVPGAHPGLGAGDVHGLARVRIADPRAEREIGLVWSAESRLLPAAELFRQHVLRRASEGTLPV